MLDVQTCLFNDVDAFHFTRKDFVELARNPHLRLTVHDNAESFLACADTAQVVLTWEWPQAWYQHCPRLQHILTPAAGDDWVVPDPNGRVSLVHGSFHGPLLAESLLSAILYMNHNMPAMVRNFQLRGWDRNLQRESRRLSGQQVLLVGYGAIASHCEHLLAAVGLNVTGVRRSASPADNLHTLSELPALLGKADHVVLLLPGTPEVNGLMSADHLRQMKAGAFLYNFGRGNAIVNDTLLAHLDHLGGAFLDVLEAEPLPVESPLWTHPKVMITPHSSCVYADYRAMFINEVRQHLQRLMPT